MPLGAMVAKEGWRGFRGEAWRPLARALYWLEVLVLMLLGIWAPLKLLAWTPHLSSFRMQMASFIARLLAAYLLFVAAWLLLEFFSSGGSPRASHARTASAP